MSQTRTLALLAIALLFLSAHSMSTSGASEQGITPEVQKEVENMMDAVNPSEIWKQSQLIYYATQVFKHRNKSPYGMEEAKKRFLLRGGP
jgi:hypothetical protein